MDNYIMSTTYSYSALSSMRKDQVITHVMELYEKIAEENRIHQATIKQCELEANNYVKKLQESALYENNAIRREYDHFRQQAIAYVERQSKLQIMS